MASRAGHLVRLAAVVVTFLVGFLVLRRAVIPKDFGQLGHYRPAALDDNRQRAMVFAGQGECAGCHEEQVQARQTGKHAKVACEACHGPAANHAADPGVAKPTVSNVVALCVRCHAKDAAKPPAFPQVVAAEHNSDAGSCNNCHQPHKPKL
jgi:cytochrome c553